MSLLAVLESLGENPQLKSIEFKTISQYIRLIPHLKNIIGLPQPANESTDGNCPPLFLPPSIVKFFSRAFGLTCEDIQNIWDIVKEVAWESELVGLTPSDYMVFKLYGWDFGISKHMRGW